MEQHIPSLAEELAKHLFADGGEMGARMRALDWASTPVGPVETWSPSLATVVATSLRSRFPIVIWWGRQHYTMFYNDAYISFLGKTKHPGWLGRSGKECWQEIWSTIGPMLEGVFATGQPTWSEDLLLVLDRNLPREENYFTFSYSAIPGEAGGVDGIFCACTETTERVLGERRLRTLRDLGSRALEARSAEEACQLAVDVLSHNQADLPFALIYLLNRDRTVAHLAALSGVTLGSQAAVPTIPIAPPAPTSPWPLAEVAAQGRPLQVRLAVEDVGTLPGGPWPESPDSALVLPLLEPSQSQVTGFLVVGVNPRRVLDEPYRDFFTIVASQVATAIANARAYEEERHRAEVLAELDQAKTQFFNNVSHEFRTPLTLLLGPLEDLLAAPHLSLDLRSQLELMHRNGLRLLKLVNTLLDFSRIEAGRAQAVYAPTDLAALTTDLASVFRSPIEKAGLRLMIDCPQLSEPVYVDRDLWEKIVLNLLSNAFKFTFTGEIAVTLREIGGQAQLAVRDTGVGIASEELPRLFERFHRVQGTRSRTHEGSGIGLALVQELVRLHGGALQVESQVGVGSTFRVTLPLGAAHLSADHLQASQPLASTALGAAPFLEEARRWLPESTSGAPEGESWFPQNAPPSSLAVPPGEMTIPAHILLADDNADLRDYLSRLLGARYMVEAVADGAAALAAAQARPPDLVLADVMMPELDGFGLLRALRADPHVRGRPIILLSARAGEEAIIEGLQAGADDYLIKPFSARELLARVESCLVIARLRQEAESRARELDAVFEAMSDGVGILDPEGRLRRLNQAGLQMLRVDLLDDPQAYFSGSVGEGSRLFDLRDEQGRPLPLERLPQQRIVRGETLAGAEIVETLVRPLDGREQVWSFGGAPIRDEQGGILGGVTTFRDVTERRDLERRTAESLAALLEMARALVQGVGDETQETLEGTSILARLLRLVQRALSSQYTAATLVTPETGAFQPLMVVGVSPEVEARWGSDLKSGKVSDYITPEMAGRLYAGEVLTFDLVGQPPIPGQDYFELQQVLVAAVWVNPRQICLLGVGIRNRPAFTQAEQDLAQAAVRLMALVLERDRLLGERIAAQVQSRALDSANQEMSASLSLVGHELRTPITSIRGQAQLLKRRLQRLWDSAETSGRRNDEYARARVGVEEGLDRIEGQTHRMNRLVEDLLEVARLQTTQLEMRREPCDLSNLVEEVVAEQQLAWPERQLHLRVTTAEALWVEADVERLRQVVTNYLTNALKYAPLSPIEISLRQSEQQARVEVRDEGPGIPHEEQDRIWERFHRVPGLAVPPGAGGGLGLGLYLCKVLIEGQGGAVGVESVPKQGATFWFMLPLL